MSGPEPLQPVPPSQNTPGSAPDLRGLPAGYPFKPDWEITPRRVRELLDERALFILLDCRRPEEHEAARIAGDVFIPMTEVERRADELEDDAGGCDTPVVVYCHHGHRSLRVTAALRAMGFSDVKSMAGGIEAWSLGVDPTTPRY